MRAATLVACVWLLAAKANAQDAPRAPSLVLIAEEGATLEELRAIAPEVASELGMDVRVDSAAGPGEIAVRVLVVESVVEIEITRADGQRARRAFELPESPVERTHALAVITINLARDQTTDLLALLRARGDATDAAAPPAAAERARPAVSPERADDTALDPWQHRVLRFGAGGQLGFVEGVGGGFQPWGLYGIDFVVLPIPVFGVGLRDVSFFPSAGRVVVQLAPVVELAYRASVRVALHAVIGCDVQISASGASAAPRLGLGARFFLLPALSVAVDATLRVIASNAFRAFEDIIAQGTVPVAFAVSLAVHI